MTDEVALDGCLIIKRFAGRWKVHFDPAPKYGIDRQTLGCYASLPPEIQKMMEAEP